jgi:queuine tRNA-ribosyltransferase
MRLLTIHNLAFVQRLMAELRDAIDAGRFAAAAQAVRAGAAPWNLKGSDPFKLA